jgi:hypothetical protein
MQSSVLAHVLVAYPPFIIFRRQFMSIFSNAKRSDNAFYAGFDAYVNGTDLNYAEQGSHWQSGYDFARDDHLQMEAGILAASAAEEAQQWGVQLWTSLRIDASNRSSQSVV